MSRVPQPAAHPDLYRDSPYPKTSLNSSAGFDNELTPVHERSEKA